MDKSKTDEVKFKVKTVEVALIPPNIDFKKISDTIKEHIKSPEEINAVGVIGTVEVKFKIEDDGNLTNFEVVKILSPETDAEALRVAKLLPKYDPLIQQEGSITTGISGTIPIRFPYQSTFDN